MSPNVDLTTLGVAVGHATDVEGGTGLTVVRGIDGPLRAGVSIFGRATGTRELHAASPDHLIGGRVDAILFTGGSAFGLDATAGVMRWMEEHRRGLQVGPAVIPIVPAAVVFDLSPIGRESARPTPQMAYDACRVATPVGFIEGTIGAGTGTTVGKIGGPARAMKGGFACSSDSTADGALTVAAMVVVNAFGDVRDARGDIIAGARAVRGGFVDASRVLRSGDIAETQKFDDLAFRNTTLAVIAVNRPMESTALTQLARAAGAALFRRITPCGSSFDGDVVFAVSADPSAAWSRPRPAHGALRGEFEPMIIESLAVSALEQAIERAVRLSRGRDGIPGLADLNVR